MPEAKAIVRLIRNAVVGGGFAAAVKQVDFHGADGVIVAAVGPFLVDGLKFAADETALGESFIKGLANRPRAKLRQRVIHEPMVDRLAAVESSEDLADVLSGLPRTFQTTNMLIANIEAVPEREDQILYHGLELLGLNWMRHIQAADTFTSVLTRKADRISASPLLAPPCALLERQIQTLEPRMLPSAESAAYLLKKCGLGGAYNGNIIRIATSAMAMRTDFDSRNAYNGASVTDHLYAVKRHFDERPVEFHLHELSSVISMCEQWDSDPLLTGPARALRATTLQALPTVDLPQRAIDDIRRTLEF